MEERNEEYTHEPVLLSEVLELLVTDRAGVYLDATLGLGGHAEAVLEALDPEGRLLAVDADPEALAHAGRRLAAQGPRLRAVHCNFRNLSKVLAGEAPASLSGALFDLGVSSLQMDKPSRGFAFRHDGPLDMRLDPGSPLTAARIVNEWPAEQLELLLREYGEERAARRIARWIVDARAHEAFETTGQLKTLLEQRLPRVGRIHPATKTFMALRIAVNQELEALTRGLESVLPALKPGARLAVISFHSLEDRIVKNLFKSLVEAGTCASVTDSPVCAAPAEVARNPRSRSAKLRVIERRK
ncbi:MAG: 16S rRNA (cytosine(1402)-N(4))-methyltransferase RsmH [Elusimicrobia bacterium]|nr:16S rRNA (cytosine(1402)-N(4))-methyltransferase RsmH [Elusimicrobiota bacterium]